MKELGKLPQLLYLPLLNCLIWPKQVKIAENWILIRSFEGSYIEMPITPEYRIPEVSKKRRDQKSSVFPHSGIISFIYKEILFKPSEFFYGSCPVKIFIFAKFQIKIRKHDFFETWTPIGISRK